MCRAFSCVITRKGKVHWQFGSDSHSDLVEKAGLADLTADKAALTFARAEITPKNGNYRRTESNVPRNRDLGEWTLTIDEQAKPTWWSVTHEVKCRTAHGKWAKQLYAVLDCEQEIVNPFTITPRIAKKHLNLLRQWVSVRDSVEDSVRNSAWDSVGDSVRASVGDSVGDSVRDSVRNSAWASVWASVRASAGDSVRDSVWVSVRDSVWAQIGSLFFLPRTAWKYTEHLPAEPEYPFQSAVDLWNLGLVPSYDGQIWRLHAGLEVKVVWEGKI